MRFKLTGWGNMLSQIGKVCDGGEALRQFGLNVSLIIFALLRIHLRRRGHHATTAIQLAYYWSSVAKNTMQRFSKHTSRHSEQRCFPPGGQAIGVSLSP